MIANHVVVVPEGPPGPHQVVAAHAERVRIIVEGYGGWMARACESLRDSITEGRLEHDPRPVLRQTGTLRGTLR